MLKYVPQHTVFYHKRYHKNKKTDKINKSNAEGGYDFSEICPLGSDKGPLPSVLFQGIAVT